ncbi:MAG: BlaI/MecI/CopY family transcriptional regulator [Planctomycetota bacterium]
MNSAPPGPEASRPTQGELELLHVLWEHGDSTLADAHKQFPRAVGYTTVQTRLNRLVRKGLATRQKIGRHPSTYSAAIRRDQVIATMLNSLLRQVTGGRIVPLVAVLVENRDLSIDEIRDLKRLIHAAEVRLRQHGRDASPEGSQQ